MKASCLMRRVNSSRDPHPESASWFQARDLFCRDAKRSFVPLSPSTLASSAATAASRRHCCCCLLHSKAVPPPQRLSSAGVLRKRLFARSLLPSPPSLERRRRRQPTRDAVLTPASSDRVTAVALLLSQGNLSPEETASSPLFSLPSQLHLRTDCDDSLRRNMTLHTWKALSLFCSTHTLTQRLLLSRGSRVSTHAVRWEAGNERN